METDINQEGVGGGRFLRNRVNLEVSKPLLRGMNIRGVNGSSFKVYFHMRDCQISVSSLVHTSMPIVTVLYPLFIQGNTSWIPLVRFLIYVACAS